MKIIMDRSDYPPAPEGWHTAEIYKTIDSLNPFTKKPQLQVVFKIVDKKGCSPVLDWFNPIAHPKAKIWKLIWALGLDMPKDVEYIDFDPLIGRQLRIRVEHKRKRGTVYANIVEYDKAKNLDDLYDKPKK